MLQRTPTTVVNLLQRFASSGVVVAFVVLFVALAAFVPNFFTPRNMQGLLLSVSIIGCIAATMMLVLNLVVWVLDPQKYVGRSPEITDEFLANEVEPMLARYPDWKTLDQEDLRV